MSRLLAVSVFCALAGALFAVAGPASAAGIEFDIVPLGDSGVSGSGNLEPLPEDPGSQTRINLELSGLEPDSQHANRVHSGTGCDDVGAVVFDLDDIVADADGNASVSTTLATSTQPFSENPHVIIVFAGATIDSGPIACAVLPAAEVATGIGTPPGQGGAMEPPSTGSAGLLSEESGRVSTWWWRSALEATVSLLLVGGFAAAARAQVREGDQSTR